MDAIHRLRPAATRLGAELFAVADAREPIVFRRCGRHDYYSDAPDANGASTSGQLAFYRMSNYAADSAVYDSTVFINTPITTDSSGNIYLDFR